MFHWGIKLHDSEVLIIATHVDMLQPECKEETIKKLNADLHELITSCKFEDIVEYKDEYSKSKEVVFPVSNTELKEKHFEDIRNRIHTRLTGTATFENLYPLSYQLFSLALVQHAECVTIAEKFGIDKNKMDEMLTFCHHVIGTIRYYNVEGLNHLIIKEPRVVLNKLTELMVKTFPKSKALSKLLVLNNFLQKLAP